MDFAKEARIELSTLCNHDCVFCTHDILERKKEIMPFELLELVLDKIKDEDITQVTVSGFGETFMDKDAIEKIEYIKSKGYDINILTNGTLLTEDIIDSIFDLEVNNLRISVHAIDADKFKSITHTELFDKLMDNLSYISTKRNGVTKVTATNVVEIDQDADKIIEKLTPLVDELEIWRPHNWSAALNYREGTAVKKTCGRPFRGPLQVQVDGTVNMCCFDYDGKLLLGDLKTQTIEEIFHSQAYLLLKQRHKDGNFIDSDIPCIKCDQRIEYDGLIYSSVNGDRVHMFSSSHEDMK